MIKYNLECSCGETFESWFQNSSEYEKLLKKNLINCYVCGSSKTVKKSIMAPSVATSKSSAIQKDTEQLVTEATNQLNSQKEKALKALEEQVNTLSEQIKNKLISKQLIS